MTSPNPSNSGHLAKVAGLGRTWASLWADVFRHKHHTTDVLSGLTVAAVALPLNLALAVASGLPPAVGLVAGAIGGGLAAAFGGAPLQITGPAAALSAMVFALVHDFGIAGAAAAALVVGGIQILLGLALAGRLAKHVPESVLAGFTTGVGLRIFDTQLPEFMGFDYRVVELAQMIHRPAWLHEVSWLSVLCGLFVAFLVVSLRAFKRFPAALVAIAIVTAISAYVGWDVERVGALPTALPPLGIPELGEKWFALALAAIPLAVLAGAESLISARAADRMVKDTRPHEPNLELVGQGIANLGAGLFGGMPVSGVIVRTGVNAQCGGRTRLAGLVHAGALLASMLFLGTTLAKIPLAALAGLLLVVGLRLVEVNTLAHLWKTRKIEAFAFLATCVGTVTGRLVTGLVVGMLLHAFGRWLEKRDTAARDARAAQEAQGIRAVVGVAGDAPPHDPPQPAKWLRQIRERAQVAASAFVHNHATVIGRVVLGEHVHIAAGASVRADEGTPFFIGSNSNIQDGVVIHALKERRVVVGDESWAVYVGRNVSLAHDALVHGPCFIGDDTFVGFKAVVHDAVVGARCSIGIGAVVVGVELPDGVYVPHGAIVDSPEAVAKLPPAQDKHLAFNHDVVAVNRGLAAAYRELHAVPREESA